MCLPGFERQGGGEKQCALCSKTSDRREERERERRQKKVFQDAAEREHVREKGDAAIFWCWRMQKEGGANGTLAHWV